MNLKRGIANDQVHNYVGVTFSDPVLSSLALPILVRWPYLVSGKLIGQIEWRCYKHWWTSASRHIIDGWNGPGCLCCPLAHPHAGVDGHCKARPLVNQPYWFGLKCLYYQLVNHKIWVVQVSMKWYFCICLFNELVSLPMTDLDSHWRGFHSIKAKKLTQIWTCLYDFVDI